MGDLSKMLAKLDAPPTSSHDENQVTGYAKHLPLGSDRIDSDKVVSLFWSTDRFNDPRYDAAEETAVSNPEAATEELGIPFLKLVGVLFLTAIVVGIWYSQLRTQNHTALDPAPVTSSMQETAPQLVDSKPSPAEELPSKVDDASWNDILSRYQQFLTQQNGTSQDKEKRAANEQVLSDLESWMNSTPRK